MLMIAFCLLLPGQYCGTPEPALIEGRCVWTRLDISVSHALPTNLFPWGDVAIESALDEWSDVIPFRFHRVAGNGDIRIAGTNIDGPKKTLAWSYLPCYDHVEQRYDISEGSAFWSYVNARSVILHEMGHALGLLHTSDPDDVMFPFFEGKIKPLSNGDKFQLTKAYRHFLSPDLPPHQAGNLTVGQAKTATIPAGYLAARWALAVPRSGVVQVSTWPPSEIILSQNGKRIARFERIGSLQMKPGVYTIDQSGATSRASIATKWLAPSKAKAMGRIR